MKATLFLSEPANIHMAEWTFFTEMKAKIATLNKDEKERFEERAAIMEFEGGLGKMEAEWHALNAIIESRLAFAG